MQKGMVIKSTGSWYEVVAENGEKFICKIKGNFRIKDIKSTNPVAVGDRVEFTIEKSSNNYTKKLPGWITAVAERKNYIVRRSPNLSKQSHIIAANIDQTLLVATIVKPVTTTIFIDRYLASAVAYRIPAALAFNKTDIYSKEENAKLQRIISVYDKIGYQCIETSATMNIGIDKLKNILKDKINVISGHSGVGKSTLINLICPNLNLKTSSISDIHKTGKHTTAYTEMYELPFGGYIIDTPGIKGFGLLDMENWEISHYFPEIFEISKYCKYYNCTHTHEPGCAVKEAVEKNKIAQSRYISYLGMLEEDDKYRKPH
jgi:ribosome biogenesis GTPase / thiamine phosphate phosphatase